MLDFRLISLDRITYVTLLSRMILDRMWNLQGKLTLDKLMSFVLKAHESEPNFAVSNGLFGP